MQVDAAGDVCTVIVSVDAPDPQVMAELRAHAEFGLRVFGEHDGYIAGALHLSEDGGRLVQYVQWSSADAYRTCLSDDRWDTVASATRFAEHITAGRATMDVRIYDVVASS